jgi:OOP family OmpA-OmpF porin
MRTDSGSFAMRIAFLLLSLIALGGLIFHVATIVAASVEKDVAGRTQAALEQSVFKFASISAVDGRDVTVTGEASDAAAKEALMKAMRTVYGVRKVRDDVKVAPPLVTLPPTDPERMTIGPVTPEASPAQGTAAATALAPSVQARAPAAAPAPSAPTPLEAQAAAQAETCQRRMNDAVREQRIVFAPGSAEIGSDSAPVLRKLARLASACPAAYIRVGGHTDNRGDQGANKVLSEARAQSVRTALIKLGVSRSRIGARGYGHTRAIASNKSSEGRARNRRIEFYVR